MWHYYDDLGVLSTRGENNDAQDTMCFFCEVLRVRTKASKKIPSAIDTVHLGVCNDLSGAASGFVQLKPKAGRIDSMISRITDAFGANKLSSGDAASLRGEFGFLHSTSFNRTSRGFMGSLKQRQYSELHDDTIHHSLGAGLRLLIHVLLETEPAWIALNPSAESSMLMWTDACWEPGSESDRFDKGLGGLLRFPSGVFQYIACNCPISFVNALYPRKTQIILCEAIAAIASVWHWRDQLRNRFLILFIDSVAVACAITKGAADAPDLQYLVSAFHLICTHAHIKWWIEWLPSTANPSDELSREGSFHGRAAQHLEIPDFLIPQRDISSLFHAFPHVFEECEYLSF